MGQPAESAVEIRDFRGMAGGVDDHDIPPGLSRLQINVTAVRPGELNLRRGLKEISYDAEDN